MISPNSLKLDELDSFLFSLDKDKVRKIYGPNSISEFKVEDSIEGTNYIFFDNFTFLFLKDSLYSIRISVEPDTKIKMTFASHNINLKNTLRLSRLTKFLNRAAVQWENDLQNSVFGQKSILVNSNVRFLFEEEKAYSLTSIHVLNQKLA